MRAVSACSALLCLAATLQPATAQEPCKADAKSLGVARTLEIDTASAPKFGFQYQHKQDLLADGEVVLTFDDGPMRAYTRTILDALSAHCTKATFFLVGRMAVSDPEMVKEIDRRGHTVATHTWSHANLQGLTPLKALAEIELGFAAVQQALGKPIAPFFRYPYLRDTRAMALHLEGRHIGTFSIDVDSKDFATRDSATVHHRVMAQLAHKRKGIVLFHDIHASTARALPGLLTDLKARGYRVVHIEPKVHVTTLAQFDDQAKQELERKQLAASGLSRRALPLPVKPEVRVASDEHIAAPKAQQPAAARPPRPAPRRVRPREDDWQTNLWR